MIAASPNIQDVIILTFLFTTASKYIYPRVDEAIHEAERRLIMLHSGGDEDEQRL